MGFTAAMTLSARETCCSLLGSIAALTAASSISFFIKPGTAIATFSLLQFSLFFSLAGTAALFSLTVFATPLSAAEFVARLLGFCSRIKP